MEINHILSIYVDEKLKYMRLAKDDLRSELSDHISYVVDRTHDQNSKLFVLALGADGISAFTSFSLNGDYDKDILISCFIRDYHKAGMYKAETRPVTDANSLRDWLVNQAEINLMPKYNQYLFQTAEMIKAAELSEKIALAYDFTGTLTLTRQSKEKDIQECVDNIAMWQNRLNELIGVKPKTL
ncbi:hypothetical protein [Vibrio phage BONAISHI]|nr:hypothetical protein [Vibrio phage BONAISHI]